MSPKILAFTRYDRTGASSRVRFLQYIPHLEHMGAQVTVRQLLPPDHLNRLYEGKSRAPLIVAAAMAQRLYYVIRDHNVDIIWLQRELIPFAPYFLEKILLGHQKLVVDFDDAHHLYYKNLPSSLVRSIYGSKVENLMQRADAVVVGNQNLAEYAHAAGATNVKVIPSSVDVRRFKESNNETPNDFQIGWIGTPVTAKQSLPIVCEPLIKFLSDFQAKCVLIGVSKEQFPEIPADRLAWSEAVEENILPQLSVGLCPLDDTPWNRGKSGYKIIQYMASGKPALVSPVGIAKEIVEHGVTGFHCTSASDWHSYLTQLYQNPELRAAMGSRAMTEAKAKYDSALAAEALYSIFEECLRD
ncbi:MAG: glycosyl transferase family 1 [Candidatus Marinimicrobia bacterium]|nr:glycosyl transferase family 1 [Candidatus Neomarinimicrobiota bacterium]